MACVSVSGIFRLVIFGITGDQVTCKSVLLSPQTIDSLRSSQCTVGVNVIVHVYFCSCVKPV